MELLILIGLLIIIALLLQDKKLFRKKSDEKVSQRKVNTDIPAIMGQSKPITNFSILSRTTENLQNIHTVPNNVGEENVENKEANIQIPVEKLDEVFGIQPDFEEEEEEWKKYGIFVEDQDLAYGVTFEELKYAGTVLKKEEVPSFQKNAMSGTVQKIQGTVLIDLLENSIEGGAVKIAELLNSTLSVIETNDNFSNVENAGLDNFDIEKFT